MLKLRLGIAYVENNPRRGCAALDYYNRAVFRMDLMTRFQTRCWQQRYDGS